MYNVTFVGRSRELETLERLWNSSKAALLILYGRRRVGKTRLLTHWLQQKPGVGLYWVAEPASALTQLRSFSQALMAFIDPEAEIPPDFTYSTWELAFRQLARFAQDRRIALFIDEVTYLIDVSPDFVGTLQKVWDHGLSDANLMLALAGSQMGLMHKYLLDYQAPLHGRITAQMKLPPLPYAATREYFPTYSCSDRVTLYAMWGGIPAYWERLDPASTVIENLRSNILPTHAWMVDESRILLQDFITDLHNYVGIMRAIADEQQALGEISKRTGLSSGKASFYLSVLRDTGFVQRRVPISQRDKDSRRGRYFVTDPYLRFFYRFLSASQSKLALGQIEPVVELIQEDLAHFIAANTWQELCRDWLLMASAQKSIAVTVEEVGSEWTRSSGVDVVGISEPNHSLVLGDCYWDGQQDVDVIAKLIQKTSSMLPKSTEPWKVHYVLFSSAGWVDSATARAKAMLNSRPRRGKHWRPESITLIDLEQVDADLAKWSV